MANDNLDLQAEVDALRLENEALRREQDRLLAERKEAFDLVLRRFDNVLTKPRWFRN